MEKDYDKVETVFRLSTTENETTKTATQQGSKGLNTTHRGVRDGRTSEIQISRPEGWKDRFCAEPVPTMAVQSHSNVRTDTEGKTWEGWGQESR